MGTKEKAATVKVAFGILAREYRLEQKYAKARVIRRAVLHLSANETSMARLFDILAASIT